MSLSPSWEQMPQDPRRDWMSRILNLSELSSSVTNGASRGGCSPSCPEHLSKACSGWACSHLRQKHSFQSRTAPSLCQESRDVSRSIRKRGSPPHSKAHVPQLCAYCPPDGRLLAHAKLSQGVGWAGVRLANPCFSSSQSQML